MILIGFRFSDVFVSAHGSDRQGNSVRFSKDNLLFGYRDCDLPDGVVITSVTLQSLGVNSSEALHEKMDKQVAKRNATQPTKDLSAGSTFRNPAGFSSTGLKGDSQALKAWKLIDDAGCRGLTYGGAQMSTKHPNFLINTGVATAKDLEELGDLVRKKVYDYCGLTLEWEIMRVGDPK